MFNIQLNYDPDQALDLKSWDGNFHAISLHGSMEHITSDVLSIKNSLLRIKKYILGKSINGDKANNFKDLSGMGKSIWEFISSVYNLHWDVLFVDENNTTLRNKVKLKFASQVKFPQTSNKGKDTPKPTFVSSIPPPIPAKSPKEVKEISKFFKKIKKPTTKKSYVQVSTPKPQSSDKSSNIAMNTLKIKETFPNFPNNKIDSIQKVINGSNNKAKPRLNMTTKGPSCKQVIIPMSCNLSKRFIKDLSSHVININQALKSIKSNICTDFICADNKGIIISTNNVAVNSDLQKIGKYVKRSLTTNDNSISSLQLPQSKFYLKIMGISYFVDKSNICISSEDIKHILKSNHIFNNIILALKPCIIKVSPKSDMAIFWIDI